MVSLSQLKREAKELSKTRGMKRTLAHEIIARSYGFNSYNHYLKELDKLCDAIK
jgi:hypothetical protein